MLALRSLAHSFVHFRLRSGSRLKRLKKLAISLFIIISLTAQVMNNLNVSQIPDNPDAPYPVRVAISLFNIGHWGIVNFAWRTGTNTYWRMASPVPKHDWWMMIAAHYSDGRVVELPLPDQTERTFWQHTFTDSRETEIHITMWPHPHLREAYGQHLCQTYPHPTTGEGAEFIRFTLYWQNILPQQEAERRGMHLDEIVRSMVAGEIECQL